MKNKKTLIIIILILIIALGGYFLIQKIQKESRKYEIETVSEYKYFVVKQENEYGVIDSKRKQNNRNKISRCKNT